MRKIQTAWNRHRASRKQVTIRNVIILLILVTITAFLVRTYMNENSMEQAVKNYCTEYFFGPAKIDAVQTYQYEGKQQKSVYISKTTEAGERYEAIVYLERDNPLKWGATGSAYYSAPAVYDSHDLESETDAGQENLADMFSALGNPMSSEVILTQNELGQNLLSTKVNYLMRVVDSFPTTCIEFQVNLDTETCVYSKVEPIPGESEDEGQTWAGESGTLDQLNQPVRDLWLSDDYMVFMAKTIFLYEDPGFVVE